MLKSLATWAVTHRRSVLAGTVMLAILFGVIASQTMPHLQLARFAAEGSASIRTAEKLEAHGGGIPNVTLLVRAEQGVDSPEVVRTADAFEQELTDTAGVDSVSSYWSTGRWEHMRSADGTAALITLRMLGDATIARQRLQELETSWAGEHGAITVAVGGRDEVFRQAAEQARADFGLAEMLILPGVFILLLFILRRPWAAVFTLALGVFSVIGAMALVRGFTLVTDVSIFAANLILIMGLALGVDYGLFIIARYREARANGHTPQQAAIEAVDKAGHTVLVSGLAVCAAMIVLLAFPFAFLRSFTYAGISVVLCAMGAALIVLPAILATWGTRIDRAPSSATSVFYRRFVQRILRAPALFFAAGLAVLILLGLPGLGLNPGPPDDRTLPPTASSRMVQEEIRADFDTEVVDVLTIVPSAETPWPAAETATYKEKLEQLPGVLEVVEPANKGLDLTAPLVVVPTAEALETNPYGLVADIRAVQSPTPVLVGGYPAELSDFRDVLISRLPWVIALMVLLSTLVLVAATRTIVLPIKAAILNALSLSVLAGVLVWVFQDGHFSGLLGFTPTGSLDLSIPILMLCIAFGLSMDYEVLILTRIVEEHRAGADLDTAITRGIEKSAPLVSAASTVLAASFLVYISSSISYLKMLGLGMALVILVDATLIRLVLVPAAVKLLGSANWWWPSHPKTTGYPNTSTGQSASLPPR